jgi:thioredoxin 1
MKKNIIFAIVAVLAVLGVAVIVVFSNTKEKTVDSSNPCSNTNTEAFALEKDNAASEIGVGETKLTCENFKAEVEDYKGVMLVDMYSPTCPHCVKLGPVFSEMAKENADKYKFGKINVMAYTDTGTKYNIESVPALVFFKDGKEVTRLLGQQTKEVMLGKLAEIAK